MTEKFLAWHFLRADRMLRNGEGPVEAGAELTRRLLLLGPEGAK
jgi:hypothetical protein